MKIVLLKDVKGVGRAQAEVEAADGHALNFLIPRKLAVPATPAARALAQARRAQAEQRKELDAKLLAENFAALAQARIVLKARANEQGHLYDAVGAPEISRAAKLEARIDLPEEAVKLEKPLKELGTFTVPVAAGELFGEFSIRIEAA